MADQDLGGDWSSPAREVERLACEGNPPVVVGDGRLAMVMD